MNVTVTLVLLLRHAISSRGYTVMLAMILIVRGAVFAMGYIA